jgi:uncharacterized membrane protein (DUF4010 family)
VALSVPEAKLLPTLAPTFVHGSRGLLAFSVRCAVGSSVATVVSEARLLRRHRDPSPRRASATYVTGAFNLEEEGGRA